MDALDEALRARDPDRWLSSRFVGDACARGRLVALYSLDGEWARVAGAVTTPLAGEIRFAWWSEALERFAAGAPAEHPALAALGREAVGRLLAPLEAVVEARRLALDGGAPSDAADVALMAAAIRLLDPEAPEAATLGAARAWAAARSDDPASALNWLAGAEPGLCDLSVAAFPAVAHVTLARAYAAGRRPGELEKRARITWAVLRGRV